MYVVATAGHVDHGKSTLIRALTGMEPDRWAEERRRGMTIDLGFAWSDLPSGRQVAFVDVPGHERFVTNMLAGAGQVPAAMLVVAADEGWKAQTVEHVDALAAFGVRNVLAVVSRADLADPRPVVAATRERLAAAGFGTPEVVAASAVSGAGIEDLRLGLDRLVGSLSDPPVAPARLWVDRAFVIKGAGAVVTGTLITGRLRVGDEVEIAPSGRRAAVRGLESCKVPRDDVAAVARVAVNLRGMAASELERGQALVAVGSAATATTLDVALTAPLSAGMHALHLGSATVQVRVRPLGADRSRYCRLTLSQPVPVRLGDRGLLRDPGRREVVAGVDVLDADPPPLARRGSAALRAAELQAARRRPPGADIIDWRGVVDDTIVRRLGAQPGDSARRVGRHWVSAAQWARWVDQLSKLVQDRRDVGTGEAAQSLGLPDPEILAALAGDCSDIESVGGRLRLPGEQQELDATTAAALAVLERRLAGTPFQTPDRRELDALGIDDRALALAVRSGRLVRVAPDVYLRPGDVEVAVARLRAVAQPFTVAAARDALDSSRRVVVPLLQHLDATRRTRRVDECHRAVNG